MDRCALFVDAGYALADGAMAVHGTRRRDSVSWDHAGLLKLLAGLARDRTGLPVLRCYWYEIAEGRRTAEHDALAEMPGLKLRLVNTRPGRREGIESQLRRDLVTLAKSGAIADAFIASADEHLAEIVSEVQDLGLRVVVLHVASDGGWTIPQPLRQECDDIVEISGVHLRPFVDLIRGAEPAVEELRANSGVAALANADSGAGLAGVGAGSVPDPRSAPPVAVGAYPAPVGSDYGSAAQPYTTSPASYGEPADAYAGAPAQAGSHAASGARPHDRGAEIVSNDADARGLPQPGGHANGGGHVLAGGQSHTGGGHVASGEQALAASHVQAAAHALAGDRVQAGGHAQQGGPGQPGAHAQHAGHAASVAQHVTLDAAAPQHAVQGVGHAQHPADHGLVGVDARGQGAPQHGIHADESQYASRGHGAAGRAAQAGVGDGSYTGMVAAGDVRASTVRAGYQNGSASVLQPHGSTGSAESALTAISAQPPPFGAAPQAGYQGGSWPNGAQGGYRGEVRPNNAVTEGYQSRSRPGGYPDGAGQPGVGQPGVGQHGAGQPGAGQQGAGQPRADQHGGGQPGTGQHAGHSGAWQQGSGLQAEAGGHHNGGARVASSHVHSLSGLHNIGAQNGRVSGGGAQNGLGANGGATNGVAANGLAVNGGGAAGGGARNGAPVSGNAIAGRPGNDITALPGSQNGAGTGMYMPPGPQGSGYGRAETRQSAPANFGPVQPGYDSGPAAGIGQPFYGAPDQGSYHGQPLPAGHEPQPLGATYAQQYTGMPSVQHYPGHAQQAGPPHSQVGQLASARSEPSLPAVRSAPPVAISLPDAVRAAHGEGYSFGESVGRDAPDLWLDAVLARKPRMPSDLEARLLQGSVLPIDSLLHDEVRHSLRRGFWDALESARR